jgi:hypothetical protein
MVLPSAQKVKENMRKYYKEAKDIASAIDEEGNELPSLTHIDTSLDLITQKSEQGPLSSPSRHLFTRTREAASRALHQGELYKVQAYNLTRQVTQFTKKRPHNRKRLQTGGGLTAEMAQEMIRQKDEQEARTQRDQEARMLDKIRRQEAAVLKREGIIARSCERARKHVLEGLKPGDCGAGAFIFRSLTGRLKLKWQP